MNHVLRSAWQPRRCSSEVKRDSLLLGGDEERDGRPEGLPELGDVDLASALLLSLLLLLLAVFLFLGLGLEVTDGAVRALPRHGRVLGVDGGDDDVALGLLEFQQAFLGARLQEGLDVLEGRVLHVDRARIWMDNLSHWCEDVHWSVVDVPVRPYVPRACAGRAGRT